MALNLSQSLMVGGLAAHYSSMAPAPVVCRAVNWSRKSSSFFVRSDLSCRVSSAVDQIQIEMEQEEEVEEQDYSGTPYVPVYVMLPRGVIQRDHGIVDSCHLIQQLDILRSSKVDGVKVECWWGIVEPLLPKHYNWSNYKRLFQHVISCNLKLQVVLCFHGCVGDDLYIPLPRWVMEVGKKDPDIFFTDSDGRRNYECLTWGIDREPVLMNRTAFEVYRDFMKSFRQEFEECFLDGSITGVEIGLGPCGELRFPFQSAGCGWEYPAIEEFQCYDKYMMKSLKKAWEERGESWCGVRPTASYNGRPQKANYLEISHRYVSFHGRFFLNWYSRVLVDHADMLLSLAKTTLGYNCNIAAKIPGICHLWYEIESPNCDAPIISILRKYKTTINSKCAELRTVGRGEDFPEALADEIGMGWQVLCAAWAAGILVAGENDLSCYDRRGYEEILAIVKLANDPLGRHVSSFTYLRLSPELTAKDNLSEFRRFVQRMHGEYIEY